MTKGQYRVGVTFNPSKSDRVNQLKKAAAELIDLISDIDEPPMDSLNIHLAEVRRLKALAQTEIESAAMWAVKAATKQAPNPEGA